MPSTKDANIHWTTNEPMEELNGPKMSGRPRKETLAERAKRFVGDALAQDEARDASGGDTIHDAIFFGVDLLIDSRICRRALYRSKLAYETARASAERSTVSHRSRSRQ